MSGMDIKNKNTFEDLYEAEGYKLSTSASIYVPWFRCTLRCKCEKEQSMSELDRIFCMCILRGICSVKDISFVLSLDSEITEGKVYELVAAGIVTDEDGILAMTEIGKTFYDKKSKVEVKIQEHTVFINGITGEQSVLDKQFMEQKGVPDSAICLTPIKTVIKSDIENDNDICRELQREYGMHIISMTLLEDQAVIYQEETILFYENKLQKMLFALLNNESEQLDTVLASALLKKYERREIIELMQAEKHLKIARKQFVQENSMLSKYNGNEQHFKYLRNQEIRKLFLKVLDEAEKNIFIISPWINDFVVNEELIEKIENAVKRGVSVVIGYGYSSADKMKGKQKKAAKTINTEGMKKDKELNSFLMAENLQKRFLNYKTFKIFYVDAGTHEKILSYDERYTLIGSYNLLSYDGGEKCNYKGFEFRYEGGVLIEDPQFAKEVQSSFVGLFA